ncbi:Nodule Cysteine-Rich (NCR) secreted peptide [Medicago truncatula]|uniref:Nodule Cysteine-Rich (NCR) secreted peptide n=1 Tax=Medicago truncatula TaxID=3880 RepID=A0A072U0B7_MEDTR|nr:Nodule Cysteine-Rich (NCR) secreted peptide [Medicago truncatula]
MKYVYAMILFISLFLIAMNVHENFCVPPLTIQCINYTCICDDPPYGEPEYDNNDDFVTLNREKAKIKNEEMMMRERDMMIEIETYSVADDLDPHL